ncbi:PRC-barrel domain-containing protein [Tabrizicola aquatica]|uniref:PRC-barrel domain-containing protein n=1 Tax=Tabrizicola aquatica TaxID=909926 RepID=UPI0011AEF19A|nr:PRC-barrel domain-containing protein [Tabrizicola aquatica]
MKTLLLTTAMVAGLAAPVLAQDANTLFQTEAAGPSVAASELIGARIYASEAAVDADAYAGVQEGWNDIGEVNDVIIGRDGTVDAVLVDIGGFLGMGERQVAVDMAALRFVQDDATDADDWFLVMQADRAALDTAPEWVMPNADANAQTDVQADAQADAATDGTATTGDAAATDDMATDQAAEEAQADAAATDAATADANATADAGTQGSVALPEGYVAVERETLTAEMLTGANVRDTSDNSIAEISDLVLTGEGQVTDVILDVGGFLGIGAKTVAIPMDRLTVAQGGAGDVAIWVDMTKEELEALPEHDM